MEARGKIKDSDFELFDNLKLGVTYTELAERTGLSVSYLQKLVHWKQIPHVKVGRAVRFIPEEIAAWLKERREALRPRRVHVSRS